MASKPKVQYKVPFLCRFMSETFLRMVDQGHEGLFIVDIEFDPKTSTFKVTCQFPEGLAVGPKPKYLSPHDASGWAGFFEIILAVVKKSGGSHVNLDSILARYNNEVKFRMTQRSIVQKVTKVFAPQPKEVKDEGSKPTSAGGSPTVSGEENVKDAEEVVDDSKAGKNRPKSLSHKSKTRVLAVVKSTGGKPKPQPLPDDYSDPTFGWVKTDIVGNPLYVFVQPLGKLLEIPPGYLRFLAFKTEGTLLPDSVSEHQALVDMFEDARMELSKLAKNARNALNVMVKVGKVTTLAGERDGIVPTGQVSDKPNSYDEFKLVEIATLRNNLEVKFKDYVDNVAKDMDKSSEQILRNDIDAVIHYFDAVRDVFTGALTQVITDIPQAADFIQDRFGVRLTNRLVDGKFEDGRAQAARDMNGRLIAWVKHTGGSGVDYQVWNPVVLPPRVHLDSLVPGINEVNAARAFNSWALRNNKSEQEVKELWDRFYQLTVETFGHDDVTIHNQTQERVEWLRYKWVLRKIAAGWTDERIRKEHVKNMDHKRAEVAELEKKKKEALSDGKDPLSVGHVTAPPPAAVKMNPKPEITGDQSDINAKAETKAEPKGDAKKSGGQDGPKKNAEKAETEAAAKTDGNTSDAQPLSRKARKKARQQAKAEQEAAKALAAQEAVKAQTDATKADEVNDAGKDKPGPAETKEAEVPEVDTAANSTDEPAAPAAKAETSTTEEGASVVATSTGNSDVETGEGKSGNTEPATDALYTPGSDTRESFLANDVTCRECKSYAADNPLRELGTVKLVSGCIGICKEW